MNINPKRDRDTHQRDSNKTKTILFTLTALVVVLTLISFFISQVVIVKLGLATLIILSGLFLIYATYTLIKHQYSLMTTIGILLLILGFLPIAVGLDLLPGYTTLKLPVLIYQGILFGSCAFIFYTLFHVPKAQPSFHDFGEKQEKERKVWKVEEKKPSPFKKKVFGDDAEADDKKYDALKSFKPASGNKELKDIKDDSKHIQILK